MNIFPIEKTPEDSARSLCDKHIISQIKETTQMLSCAAIRHGVPEVLLPKTKSGTTVKGGYPNHPCSLWCGDNKENYIWLCHHGIELCKEYTKRFNKIHFCENSINILNKCFEYIPDGKLTKFAVAISDDKNCKSIFNFDNLSPMIQYRLYYKLDKPFVSWIMNKPIWFEKTILEIINETPNS